MQISDFDYTLPDALIAKYPAGERRSSRLLEMGEPIVDRGFHELPLLLRSGDLLVFNDTRVIAARLAAVKETGGRAEILIERVQEDNHVLAQLRASKSPGPGSRLHIADRAVATVTGRQGEFFLLEFSEPVLGAFAVAPSIACDLFVPGCRRLLAPRRRHPISMAQLGLGLLNLYRASGDRRHLEDAEAFVKPLLDVAAAVPGGVGWGMNFDWPTVDGVVRRHTPCHTQTAYAYDFFAALADTGAAPKYEDLLQRIAQHTSRDYHEWREADHLISAYSTADRRRIVNANSYRMALLLDAGQRFGVAEYTEKGLATLAYVLSMQQADGAWPYSETEPFVDTFHTCFVIKNLIRARRASAVDPATVDAALDHGLRYYLGALFDDDGLPVPFAVAPRLTLQRYDAYDIAESIGLLAELRIEPERLARLVRFVSQRLQTSAGWFRFRIYRVPTPAGIPYMRWANSAMFLALTKVLLISPESNKEGN